jgi:hypothetical protein
MRFLQLQSLHRLLTWPALMVLVAVVGYQVVAAQPGPTEVVAGSYSGTVTVTEPAPLGSLDLVLDITNANGALSGQVNAVKTQVFLGGPTFTGSVTAGQGVTPTVRIESQTFSGLVSGRTVQRHFVLTGEVLDEGDTLRGEYTETIVGFKSQPILVKGTFLMVRPRGVTTIITVPVPDNGTATDTPTPTVTPTPTQTPTPTVTSTPTAPAGNSDGAQVFLPLVSR